MVLDLHGLAVDGDDLQRELGIAPGPRLGTILQALLERVIADPQVNRRSTLLAIARSLLAGNADVIELLLEAERALSMGRADRAEVLYQQVVASDPRNSIAVVGLARVALERADDAGALVLARRALAIDGENVAAQRLVQRLEEVLQTRGEALPAVEAAPPVVAAPPAVAAPPVEAARRGRPRPPPRRPGSGVGGGRQGRTLGEARRARRGWHASALPAPPPARPTPFDGPDPSWVRPSAARPRHRRRARPPRLPPRGAAARSSIACGAAEPLWFGHDLHPRHRRRRLCRLGLGRIVPRRGPPRGRPR